MFIVFSTFLENRCHVGQNKCLIVWLPPSPVVKDSVAECCSCPVTASILQGWSMQQSGWAAGLCFNSQVTLQGGRGQGGSSCPSPTGQLYVQTCWSAGAAGLVSGVTRVLCCLHGRSRCCQVQGQVCTSPSIMDVLTVLWKPSCSAVLTSLGQMQDILLTVAPKQLCSFARSQACSKQLNLKVKE